MASAMPPSYPHRMRDLVRLSGAPAPTIHFYSQQGLLPAARKTADNQARYSAETVERIAWIRSLQQDLRLPLRSIREILDRFGPLAVEEVRTLLTLGTLLEEADPAASAEELASSSSQLAPGDLEVLRDMDLVAPRGRPLTTGDARLIELVVALRSAGFTEEQGFSARNLPLYRDSVQRLVEEEVQRFIEPALAQHDPAALRDLVHRGLPLVHQLLALLHQRALQHELQRWLETTDDSTERASA